MEVNSLINMQVNRINQQTNFKSVFTEVRPNQWQDLITKEVLSTEALKTALNGSKYKTGVVLDGIGLLDGRPSPFKFLDKARMLLTGGHSVQFKKEAGAAEQRGYLRAYLPFTYGENGGNSTVTIVNANELIG